MPKAGKVRIEIFNLVGQRIETLLNSQMPAGLHEVEFNAKKLPSGVYLYKIESEKHQDVKKMILLR